MNNYDVIEQTISLILDIHSPQHTLHFLTLLSLNPVKTFYPRIYRHIHNHQSLICTHSNLYMLPEFLPTCSLPSSYSLSTLLHIMYFLVQFSPCLTTSEKPDQMNRRCGIYCRFCFGMHHYYKRNLIVVEGSYNNFQYLF